MVRRQRLSLLLKQGGECAGDDARNSIAGRSSDDQPRAVASDDEGAVNRACIDRIPGRLLAVVGRDLERAVARDRQKRRLTRSRHDADRDVVGRRALDRRTDQPDQGDQRQQPRNHGLHIGLDHRRDTAPSGHLPASDNSSRVEFYARRIVAVNGLRLKIQDCDSGTD